MADDARKTVLLGDEWDEGLRARIREVLKEMGGQRTGGTWGVAGSQEVATFEFMVEGQSIVFESETYMGLTLSGPSPLVDRVLERLSSSDG